jgi:hypothetical protein
VQRGDGRQYEGRKSKHVQSPRRAAELVPTSVEAVLSSPPPLLVVTLSAHNSEVLARLIMHHYSTPFTSNMNIIYGRIDQIIDPTWANDGNNHFVYG